MKSVDLVVLAEILEVSLNDILNVIKSVNSLSDVKTEHTQ